MVRTKVALRPLLVVSLLAVGLLISAPFAAAPPPGGGSPPANPAIAMFDNVGGSSGDALRVMNTDGSNNVAIFSGCTINNPSWSPSGGAIAFINDCDNGALWRIDVSIVNGVPTGSNPHQLAASTVCGSRCWDPAWSPQGDFVSVGGGSTNPSILLIDAITGSAQVLYTAGAGSNVVYSTWSSDGTRLAVQEKEGASGQHVIRIVERSTGNVLQTLVRGVFVVITHMDWARQSVEKLAITAFPCGACYGLVYIVDILTDTFTQPIPGNALKAGQNAPSWSPENAKLVYAESGKIKTITLATGKLTTLATGDKNFPDWRR